MEKVPILKQRNYITSKTAFIYDYNMWASGEPFLIDGRWFWAYTAQWRVKEWKSP